MMTNTYNTTTTAPTTTAIEIDIVNLIENSPSIKLSNTYDNKLLEKIKSSFTETEQNLFMTYIFCYLHYDKNAFMIDLDNIWQWLHFNQKSTSKRLLEKHFEIGKDYIIRNETEYKKTHGGHNREKIMLSIKTFKMFCFITYTQHTHKTNIFYEFFCKMEDVLYETLKEQSEELVKQLEKRDAETQKRMEEEKKRIEEEKNRMEEIEKQEKIFQTFLDERCIINTDVEVSLKDILHAYKIEYKEKNRKITDAFTDFLHKRFTFDFLQNQEKNGVVMGFFGIKLKEAVFTRQTIRTIEHIFLFEECAFQPRHTVLFTDLVVAFEKYKKNVKKEFVKETDVENLKTYLEQCPHVLYDDNIWTRNGNGQGYYGLTLKSNAKYKKTSSTGCVVEKKDMNGDVLRIFETIAKAGEHEDITAIKMSKAIHDRTIFEGKVGDSDYVYVRANKNVMAREIL